MSKTKQKKAGPKFNIFDVLIILAMIACVSAIIVRAFILDDAMDELRSAEVRFTVENISEGTAEALCTPNRMIYLKNGDIKAGTLKEASYEAQKIWVEDANGKLVEAVHPDKKQVTATAVFGGTWGEDGFLIGGTHLAIVGGTFEIYTQDVTCTITIVSVSETP